MKNRNRSTGSFHFLVLLLFPVLPVVGCGTGKVQPDSFEDGSAGDAQEPGRDQDESRDSNGDEVVEGLCGNGVRDPEEACDADDLGGKTCQKEGFLGGELKCTPVCDLDLSRCEVDACKRPEIGFFGRASWIDQPEQDFPELTWDVIMDSKTLLSFPRTTNVFLNFYVANGIPKWTDFDFIRERFAMAETYKDRYDYGIFLFHEEMFIPSGVAGWAEKLGTWSVEGKSSFMEIETKLIKTWMIEEKGRQWDQGWWDAVVKENNNTDPLVREWSMYHAYNLYRAWQLRMRELGKKSAIVGVSSLNPLKDFRASFEYGFGEQLARYIVDNYDLIFTYNYPRTLEEINRNSLDAVKTLRTYYNYKGKIGHILTANFLKSWRWEWTEEIAREEFKTISSYVDAVFCIAYANSGGGVYEDSVPYAPILVKFWKEACP